MLDLSALEAEIARDKEVNTSAALLLKRLFDEVQANINSPIALQALINRVKAQNDDLAAAVVTNTPSA